MSYKEIVSSIQDFKMINETDDYEMTKFFDGINESILVLEPLTSNQQENLISNLFDFLKNQNPDMEENFSFIHLIEGIESTAHNIYNDKLIKFNSENATINSVILLNRLINSLEIDQQDRCMKLLKSIAKNNNYTENMRKEALGYYNHQLKK